jgi:hypothetical protein
MPALGRSRSATLLLLAVVAITSCRRPDYFPLGENQEWLFAAREYEVAASDTTETATRTYALAVGGSTVEPGLGRVYEVRVTHDEESFLSCFFRKKPDAVFVLPASRLDGFEPTAGWLRLLVLPWAQAHSGMAMTNTRCHSRCSRARHPKRGPAAIATASASGFTHQSHT